MSAAKNSDLLVDPNAIVDLVQRFLSAPGPPFPPDEDGDRPWNDAADPLVLVVDPYEWTMTLVRSSAVTIAPGRGQTT